MKEMLLRSKFFLHFGINHEHVIRGANSMFKMYISSRAMDSIITVE